MLHLKCSVILDTFCLRNWSGWTKKGEIPGSIPPPDISQTFECPKYTLLSVIWFHGSNSSFSTVTVLIGSKIPWFPPGIQPPPLHCWYPENKPTYCALIDFAELEHLRETESTTRIKMIWLTLQLYLLLLDPFFLPNGIIDLEFIAT